MTVAPVPYSANCCGGNDAAWLRWTVVVGGLLQIDGLVVFFHTMWSRIRGVGSQQREAKGERF